MHQNMLAAGRLSDMMGTAQYDCAGHNMIGARSNYFIKCVTFSKNEQLGDLFQKRFTGGICDFRGYGSCIAWHPIIIHTGSAEVKVWTS